MQLTVKALQGRECSLQVSEDELVSTLKHLVSEKLNIPVRQQRLLFKGKALADGKRLSDYSIGPNSKLNLVVKPLEKLLLEESTAQKTAEAPAPPPAAWPLISRVLARHFSAADASRVLDQLQRDYERSLSRLTLDDIERLAGRFLHPEATEAMEKGFSKHERSMTFRDDRRRSGVSASSQASTSGSEDGCLQLPPNPSVTASTEHLPVL